MEEIKEYLEHQGFNELLSFGGGGHPPCFRGEIALQSEAVRLDIHFPDYEYGYPQVYLTDWKYCEETRDKFSGGHVNTDGKICHTDESLAWWDFTLACRYLAGILLQVKTILEANLADQYDSEIVLRDFDGYWPSLGTLYLATALQNKREYLAYEKSGAIWIAGEEKSTSWLKDSSQPKDATPWIVLSLKNRPQPNMKCWPPKNLKDFCAWISLSNAGSLNGFFLLLKDLCYSSKAKKNRGFKPKTIGIMLLWPGNDGEITPGVGVRVNLNQSLRTALEQGRIKGIRALFNKGNSAITKFSIQKADPDYIHRRNLTSDDQTFQNDNVLLVGAGTIGSFLAHQLCALGAGWGKHGSLTIVDFDSLNIENVGRHLLGIESLGRNKAKALAFRLKEIYPHLEITADENSIVSSKHLLKRKNIVINATGCQTTSVNLEKLIRSPSIKNKPVLLHSWIHGQGLAALSLLSGSKKKACYRCLWSFNNDQHKFRYQISKDSKFDQPVEVGCHNSFQPYPITSSVVAASQAVTMLGDWKNSRLKKSLQIKVLQENKCNKPPGGNPDPQKNCPICQAQEIKEHG